MNQFRDGRQALAGGGCELTKGGGFRQTPLLGLACLTDTSVVGSFVTDRNNLVSLDLVSGEQVTLYAPSDADIAVDPYAGLSDVCAGYGRAAGFYQGYWDTVLGRRSELWCPLAIDDGSGAVCIQLTRGGPGIGVLIGGSDTPIVLSMAAPGFQATFRQGLLTFVSGQTRRVYQ